MLKFFSFAFLLVCVVISEVYSQPVPVNITYDTTVTKIQGSESFYLKNPSNKTITIINFRTTNPVFYYGSFTPFSINPNDSVPVTVYFKTIQNITYRDFLIFETAGLNYPIVKYVTASAKHPEPEYAGTHNLYDEQLKTVLRTLTTNGYISLGYNLGRDKMFEIIDDYGGDTIECVYTGIKIKAATRIIAQNLGFNTEHTYPQSFFNEAEPMKSDIFHLYPTEANANNVRSNYPFGFVVSNINWQQGGSKRGYDYQNTVVFEPRNAHKGNVARSLFYFCVKYGNPGSYMTQKQDSALRLFNVIDTVDERERIRNSRIKSFQNVRNPFIDHPEFVDRIISTFSIANRTPVPKISAAPYNIVFDTLAVNDTASYYIGIMNYGKANLTVNSAVSNLPEFIVESVPASVPAGELRYLKVKFKPTAINTTYNANLTVANNDSNILISLKGFSNSTIGISKIGSEIPDKFKLEQNYPNPFNSITKIQFQVPLSHFGVSRNKVKLIVFDILGKEIATLVDESLRPGKYETNFDAGNLPSGVYYINLLVNSGIDFSDFKKIVLVK